MARNHCRNFCISDKKSDHTNHLSSITFKRKITRDRLVQSKHKTAAITALFSILILTVGLPASGEADSPKKQMKRGIPAEDVICKAGLELVIRTNGYDGMRKT